MIRWVALGWTLAAGALAYQGEYLVAVSVFSNAVMLLVAANFARAEAATANEVRRMADKIAMYALSVLGDRELCKAYDDFSRDMDTTDLN